MQYILTQEEYDNLKKKQKTEFQLSKNNLQNLCTKIANNMPVDWGWGENNPKPWGCILTVKDE